MRNSAAFDPADIEDARRGHPAYDLTPYASGRGLQPLGQAIQGHFNGLTPRFKEYTFNVLRGPFPGDRFGAIQHELYEIPMTNGELRFNGSLYGTRVLGKISAKEFLGLGGERSTEPFGDDATLVPTTTVYVQVPEIVFVPKVVIRRKGFVPLLSPQLDGAPGFAMNETEHVDDGLRAALGTVLASGLGSLLFPYIELRLSFGRIALKVNGFLYEPDRLDALVRTASAMADALAQMCNGWWAPGPFDAPLGPFDPSGHPRGWPSGMFMGRFDNTLMPSLETIARDMNAVIEDPVALHRRFPRLPIPGASLGIIAGRLPGTNAFGRLTWQYQNHHKSSWMRRGGALFAAKPGVADTPPGGHLVQATEMYAAVQGGVASCWFRDPWELHFHSAKVLERALATMRHTGFAEV